MRVIAIAYDVIGAGRTDERDGYVLSDHRFKEGEPRLAAGAGVLVGEVEDLDAVLLVQPGDLFSELHGIAVPPPRPEAALAAVVA